jgi:hypothetical protein
VTIITESIVEKGSKMKRTKLFPVLMMVGALLYAAPQQATPPAQGAAPAAAPAHTWTTEQIVTSSVREAWALGGKTPEGFFEIIKALAEISAQKRGVAIPENEQSGVRAGEWIKKEAKKDPDQLLYVIVDHAVQHSANQVAGK